jgi:hypothetical protein
MNFYKSALWVALQSYPFGNNFSQLYNKFFNMVFSAKVTSMLVHHITLKSLQKHSWSLLNRENWFDLIWSFNQQVHGTLLTLRINDFLTFLFFFGLNRLFELNSVHSGLAKTSFVYQFVTSNSIFFGRIMIWILFKDMTLLLVAHFLVLF